MDPATKWMLIGGGVGAAFGALNQMFTNEVSGDSPKSILASTLGFGVAGVVVAYAAQAGYERYNAPAAPQPVSTPADPAAACLNSAPKGQTAVFERKPDGSYSCSYKPQ